MLTSLRTIDEDFTFRESSLMTGMPLPMSAACRFESLFVTAHQDAYVGVTGPAAAGTLYGFDYPVALLLFVAECHGHMAFLPILVLPVVWRGSVLHHVGVHARIAAQQG